MADIESPSPILTRQQDFGLAADQQAVAVLGGAVVLAHVAFAPLFAFLEAEDEQRAVGEHLYPGAGGHGHAVLTPGDHDGLVALDPAVQHQGTLTNCNHIAGLQEEGELRRQAATWRREEQEEQVRGQRCDTLGQSHGSFSGSTWLLSLLLCWDTKQSLRRFKFLVLK